MSLSWKKEGFTAICNGHCMTYKGGQKFPGRKQGNPRKGERGGLKPNVEYMAKEKTRLTVVILPPKKWTERKPDSFGSAATKTC